ncbi:DUF6896 domain-containing protein [Streptomyces anulatus]|uniref:DUF6896 domain-containing protein n=1 Tax=Streptomyces anulatus TaxID=1892 RepID=UPI0036336F52
MLRYVRALNTVDEAMRAALPSLDRLADVLGLARSRRISRSGRIGTYSYTVHGAGCRFVSDNGTEVDVERHAAEPPEFPHRGAGPAGHRSRAVFPSKAPRLIRLTRSSQASHLTCFRAPQ